MEIGQKILKGKNEETKMIGNGELNENKTCDFSAFYELAKLLNSTVEKVKDECCMFQVKNLMKKLTKVIVRYNVSDAELEKILLNLADLGVEEIMLSSAYLPATKRQISKNGLERLKINSIIDFPFGESIFKSKLTDVRNSIKEGVEGVTVMLPTMLLTKEKLKVYRKQVRTLKRFKKVEKGVAFAIGELSDEQIKWAIKGVEKTKLDYIAFAFGEANEMEVKDKLHAINKFKGKKEIRILGNVQSPEAVMELFKLGVDNILTPFADNIGKELIDRFTIKSVKLR